MLSHFPHHQKLKLLI